MAGSGWVSEHWRKLTKQEREDLRDRFGIEGPQMRAIERALARYRIMAHEASSRVSAKAKRDGLERVTRAIEALEQALDETDEVLSDVWSDSFSLACASRQNVD